MNWLDLPSSEPCDLEQAKILQKKKKKHLGFCEGFEPNHCTSTGCGKQSLIAPRKHAEVLVHCKLSLGHWGFSERPCILAALVKGTVAVKINISDNLALTREGQVDFTLRLISPFNGGVEKLGHVRRKLTRMVKEEKIMSYMKLLRVWDTQVYLVYSFVPQTILCPLICKVGSLLWGQGIMTTTWCRF